MAEKVFAVLLTRREIDALGEACGFRLAGDLDELPERDVEALERAHAALSRATPTSTKPTRAEYIAHVFGRFTASSAHHARGLIVSVAAADIDALVAEARGLGLDVREVTRHTERAQAHISSFRRAARATVNNRHED